jgi:SAM-dependent methyltransferase
LDPLNELLIHFGVRLSRMRGIIRPPADFMAAYKDNLEKLSTNQSEFRVFKDLQYDSGDHPESYIDHECTFAAQQIAALNPKAILDIGSYRGFVLGLLSHFEVTTVDVRRRQPISNKETVVTCDAKKLILPPDTFDVAVSLCTVEHIGLGRYGDDFDPDGDKVAMREMIRVLKPGGHLIFTTNITRAQPSIAFNAHRIYNHEMLKKRCEGLSCVKERFFSTRLGRFCSFDEVTAEPQAWDVYCGCWAKL